MIDIHKVQEPDWQVGDKVLLRDMRVKLHSDSVVTHRPFHCPLLALVLQWYFLKHTLQLGGK